MLEHLTFTRCTSKIFERIIPITTKTRIQKKEAYHHGDLRAQLVNATRRLVEEKGPDAFSVSEACRAAGVSTAAPYRHFSDKQDMLIAVAMDGMQRMREQMLAAIENLPQGTSNAIAAIGLVYVEFAQREPSVFRLMFGLTRHHRDNPDMIAQGAGSFGVLLHQLALYLGKDDDDEEVRRVGFSLWTFVHGLSFLLIDEKVDALQIPVDVKAFIDDVSTRLLESLRPAAD